MKPNDFNLDGDGTIRPTNRRIKSAPTPEPAPRPAIPEASDTTTASVEPEVPQHRDWSLERQRAAIKLETLRKERGVAKLDGHAFDSALIRAAEAELDALDAAEGEAVKRERVEYEAEMERRRAAARSEVTRIEEQRLEAVKAAHTAAIDMMVALMDVQTYADKLSTTLRTLGVKSWDAPSSSTRDRLSRRLACVMGSLMTSGQQYGAIAFPEPVSTYSVEWLSDERRLLAPDIERALHETPNK